MIRVGSLTRFSPLTGKEVATFPEDRPRNVRMTFNAPQRTVLSVIPLNKDGSIPAEPDPIFLAVVEGFEEVEFYVEGPYGISAEADCVWMFTLDGSEIHAVIPDAETFTKIAERRVRDPNMERMEALLLQSTEIRMRAALDELDREYQRRDFERQRLAEADDLGTGADGGDSQAAQQVPSGGKPASGSQKAPVGEEGGGGDA